MRSSKPDGLTRRTILTSGIGAAVSMTSWGANAAPRSVKVGSIMPSSGVLAFPGQACVRGIDLGAKFANERFGVEIEVVHADTQSKPENGRLAADGLSRQGCTVLIGAWDSGATISRFRPPKRPRSRWSFTIASATQVTSQGFTQVFRFYPTSLTVVRRALVELKALLAGVDKPPQSAAVLHLNNTMGQSTATSIDQVWKEENVPLKITEYIPMTKRLVTCRSKSQRRGRPRSRCPSVGNSGERCDHDHPRMRQTRVDPQDHLHAQWQTGPRIRRITMRSGKYADGPYCRPSGTIRKRRTPTRSSSALRPTTPISGLTPTRAVPLKRYRSCRCGS